MKNNNKDKSHLNSWVFQSKVSQLSKDTQKNVSCVAVDPKGHRMATGGLDYHVRLWDFHGMNKNMNSFRII